MPWQLQEAKAKFSQLVQKAIEVRGLKIKVTDVPVPVSYGPAFEGERVRREDMQLQFGGKYSDAAEVLESARVLVEFGTSGDSRAAAPVQPAKTVGASRSAPSENV